MGSGEVVVVVVLVGLLITYQTTVVASRAVRKIPAMTMAEAGDKAVEYMRKKYPRTFGAYDNAAWAYEKVTTGYETVTGW